VTFPEIGVGDMVGHPGTSREVRVRGTVEDLGTEVATVAGEVEAHLLLESVIEGILVSGRLSGTFSFRCARCLEAFERPFAIDVSEMFVEEPAADDDEYRLGPGPDLDPGQMAVDAIGVEVPFAPLCRPDCLGLCEFCGGNRNLGECPGHETADPRWAGLDALFERAHDDVRR
jgi:uncharacterized protein